MYNLLLHKQKPRNRIESDESNETEAHVAPLSIPICKPLPIVPCMRMSMCACVCMRVCVPDLCGAIIVLWGLENLVLPHELSQK